MIAGILLAAGTGKRFGGNKLLHELGGKPIICHSLDACLRSRLHRTYIVVRPNDDALREAVERTYPGNAKIAWLTNESADTGRLSSVKEGMRAIGGGYDAAMVVLADMPYVTSSLIDRLIDAFDRKNGIVIPVCDGERYHPRIIPASLFKHFLDLKDGESGMRVIDKYGEFVQEVTIGSRSDYVDIDTPDDIAT